MKNFFLKAIFLAFAAAFALPGSGEAGGLNGRARAVEVELQGEIAAPQVYIIRRAVKEASGADALIVNMDT
ncbi:MAG: hypothetical protein J6T16_06885, partial [Opitutales bacterium]|nr:hypothetical protein [Opitutales bacterium]